MKFSRWCENACKQQYVFRHAHCWILSKARCALLDRFELWMKSRLQLYKTHCGECHGHLFALQLQRTADMCCTKVYARAGLERRPAGAEDGRPLSSSAHARTTQDPVRVRHGSDLPAALSPHCSNTHQSLQLSPSAMLSSPTVQLAECCENVGSGRARTY